MSPTPAGPLRPRTTSAQPSAAATRRPAGTGPLVPAELDRWIAGGGPHTPEGPKGTGEGRSGTLLVTRPDPAAAASGPVDRAIARLGNEVLYRDHDIRPSGLALGAPGGAGFALRLRPLRNSESRIQDDPYRRETTRRMNEAGTPVTWAEVRGAIEPWTGLPFAVPMPGAGLTVGFSADAALALSVLSPHRQPLRQTVADLGIRLPFRAEDALAYAQGTEVELRGRGRLAVSAGARLTHHEVPLSGDWSVGASVGAEAHRSRELELAFKVKRLDGSQVAVSLEEVVAKGAGASLKAQAGLTGPSPDLPTGGGQGGDLARKALTAEALRWLSAEASIATSEREAHRTIQTFVMDLDTSEGRTAYEAALALDLRPAQRAAAAGDPASRSIRYEERSSSESLEVDARLGRFSLLDRERRIDRGQGRLTRPEGVVVVDRADLLHSHEDLLTRWFAGRKRTERQFLSVAPENGGKSETWLRSLQEVKVDLSTPEGAVRRFLVQARLLGLREVSDGMEENMRTLEAFGRSERRIEAYITAEGLETMLQAEPELIREAFAQAYEDLDRPWDQPVLFDSQKAAIWRMTPWLATSHPDHAEIMELLRQGPHPGDAEASGPSPESRYAQLTGRPLWQDAEAWREGERLVQLLGDMRSSSAAGRSRLLARHATDVDTDNTRELSTLARLAGPAGVVVPEMRLSGPDAPELSYRRGLAPRDPRRAVEASVQGHRTP